MVASVGATHGAAVETTGIEVDLGVVVPAHHRASATEGIEVDVVEDLVVVSEIHTCRVEVHRAVEEAVAMASDAGLGLGRGLPLSVRLHLVRFPAA